MKISLITATFNSQDTVLDTIKSVQEQTHKNIEHIIVDGNSSDHTLPLVEKNQIEDTIIVSQSDSGVYAALNKGIALSTGDIVAFLHSDDFFSYNRALEDVIRCFLTHDCDAVYADLRYVRKNDVNTTVRY